MKKIIIILSILTIWLFFNFTQVNAGETTNNCKFKLDKNWNFTDKWLSGLLSDCIGDTSVVAVNGDGNIDRTWVFKEKINNWTNNIALFLALLSVGSIVYGWLMMTLSVWEDEKIKKAKDIVKWSLIWFLWVVLATTIVTLVINLIYWFSQAEVNTPTTQTEISIIT